MNNAQTQEAHRQEGLAMLDASAALARGESIAMYPAHVQEWAMAYVERWKRESGD